MIGWDIWNVVKLFTKMKSRLTLILLLTGSQNLYALWVRECPTKKHLRLFGVQLLPFSFRNMDEGYGPKEPQVRHVRLLVMPHLKWSYR
jgi:hypothetical protein